MRCFASNKNDELCDICKRIDEEYFKSCRDSYIEKTSISIKLNVIKADCKFLTKCWDEYTPFDACAKNGNGYGKNATSCNPTLDCEQYCKNEIKNL